jgi:hypothetical protein
MARRADKPEADIDLSFPKAGIDVSLAFYKQPVRALRNNMYGKTCAHAVNVRCFEPDLHRARGGARAGLTKFVSTRPNGANIVQELNVLVGTDYDPPGGGTMQTSNSGRVVTLVAVVQGQIRVMNAGETAWTTPTNNTGNNPPLNFTGVMQSAPNQQKLYFADGVNWVYYQPSNNTINTWSASAGTLPVDGSSNKPRLICTWRGRTVLSGLLEDSHNWFMSAVDDPTDFDYSPTDVVATQAVAGNNGPLGVIGDVVTGLVSWSDDVLIFLGDSTIWQMTGDPMDGGHLDLITDAIGCAWGKAWCKDPDGNVYFFGNHPSVYTMRPSQQPQRLSDPIARLLRDVNTGENTIRMAWNDHAKGLHVFISDTEESQATTHYFWEQRTGAWWQDEFAEADMNPLALTVFDGNQPQDRVLLIGSWDGYVRAIDPDAVNDDGVAIESEVWLGPILTPDMDEVMLHEMQGVLAVDSGDVTVEVYTGFTAEQARASAVVDTFTLSYDADLGGRNQSEYPRVAAHAVYLRLIGTNRWALEQIRCRVHSLGAVRRRGA